MSEQTSTSDGTREPRPPRAAKWAAALAAATFILIMAAGVWQVAVIVPQLLSITPRSLHDLRTGALTAELSKRLDASLPWRTTFIATANATRYLVAHGAGADVRIGREGWLFSTEELRIDRNDASRHLTRLQLLDDIVQQLKAQHIDVVIILVPDKARLHADKLRTAYPMWHRDRYETIKRSLRSRGIALVDGLAALSALGDAPGYYRTDTHWNQRGANAVAIATALLVRKRHPNLPRVSFTTAASPPHSMIAGDLLRLMGLDSVPDLIRPDADLELPLRTRRTRNDAMTLFGEPGVDVVLIGTSFSKRGNFHGALQEHLAAPVLNAAVDGGGLFQALRSFLQDDSSGSSSPQILLWEIPERVLSDSTGDSLRVADLFVSVLPSPIR